MLNWGIIGTGSIAGKFAAGLRLVPQAKLWAIGSRKKEKAVFFSKKYHVPKAYDSYEKLVSDPDIHVVYIATPNSLHKDHCIMALNAGKAVLCEKPFTLNTTQTEEIVSLAKKKNLFCMEAMWTRFIPLVQEMKRLIINDAIGEVTYFTGDFGLIANDKNNFRFDPHFGGGSLMDLGVYPINLAHFLFGTPAKIHSRLFFGKNSVDVQTSAYFIYPDGRAASVYSCFISKTPSEMMLIGTKGTIHVHAPIYRPTKLTITRFPDLDTDSGKINKALSKFSVLHGLGLPVTKEIIKIPCRGNGYNYEANEVMRCLRSNLSESPIMPLQETIDIMKILDRIRNQSNYLFPLEK